MRTPGPEGQHVPERRRRPRRRRLNWTSTGAQVSVVFVLHLAVNTGIAGVYGLPDTALNVYIRSACHIDRSVLQPRVHHSSLHSDNKMLKPLHACYRQQPLIFGHLTKRNILR